MSYNFVVVYTDYMVNILLDSHLCGQTEHLLNQVLCVSWSLQKQFYNGCQQL